VSDEAMYDERWVSTHSTLLQRAWREDCPPYFRLWPQGILGGPANGPIVSRDRQRVKGWAGTASGRQKRNMRKKLRRMARESAA